MSASKKRLISAAVIGWSLMFSSAQAETLKFLIPWTPANESNHLTAEFVINAVKNSSKGELDLRLIGPSVVPPFKQLQPVGSGVFDIHYTSTAYHGEETGIGQLGDTITRDPDSRRTSGFWDMIDQHYQSKHNVKILGNGGSTGYQFILKEAIGPDGGLKGRKIRSNPAYDDIITTLGGSTVQTTAPQVYPSLQKGLIDGAAWTMHSVSSNKLHEVAKYLARPAFAVSTNLLVMNLDVWKKMTPERQKMFLEIGRAFEVAAYEIPAKIAADDEAIMMKSGGAITQIGSQYAKDLNHIYNKGVWDRVIKQHVDDASKIVRLIEAGNLENK